jgi:hypothetical protein
LLEINATNTARNIATKGIKKAEITLIKIVKISLVLFRIATTAAKNK